MTVASPHPLDELIRGVLQAARARDGRLVGITVVLPGGGPGELWERRLQEGLVAAGLDEVEVHRLAVGGPPRIVSLEFTR